MRVCFDAWSKMVPCRTLSSAANETADGLALQLWSGLELGPDENPKPMRWARWQRDRRWDVEWSLFAPAKDVGFNLAVDRGRPWMNMQMGKVEFNVELDSSDDARVYIGIDNRW